MGIVELDPVLAWKAVEGFTNELDPEQKALDAFYRQFKCKRCGSSCRKELVANHAFQDPNTLVPRSCLRCLSCNCLFDPHSGLIVDLGDMTKTPNGTHLIGEKK